MNPILSQLHLRPGDSQRQHHLLRARPRLLLDDAPALAGSTTPPTISTQSTTAVAQRSPGAANQLRHTEACCFSCSTRARTRAVKSPEGSSRRIARSSISLPWIHLFYLSISMPAAFCRSMTSARCNWLFTVFTDILSNWRYPPDRGLPGIATGPPSATFPGTMPPFDARRSPPADLSAMSGARGSGTSSSGTSGSALPPARLADATVRGHPPQPEDNVFRRLQFTEVPIELEEYILG